MVRRIAPFLFVVALALALSPARAATRPFTFQASGTMSSHPNPCDGGNCGVVYLGSGSLSCGETGCSSGPKPGGSFIFDGQTSPARHGGLVHPPNPCASKGSATVTVSWSDQTSSVITFSKVHFPPNPCLTDRLPHPPNPCRIRGNGVVSSGALSGTRVSFLFVQAPTDPCRSSTFAFSGSLKFFTSNPT